MSFEQPKKVSRVDVVFGNVEGLMPPLAEIPKEFQENRANKWRKMQAAWFFNGLKASTLTAKPGIDKADAISHLQAIQGSYEPKHEHKQAAVAYLASLWFADWVSDPVEVNDGL